MALILIVFNKVDFLYWTTVVCRSQVISFRFGFGVVLVFFTFVFILFSFYLVFSIYIYICPRITHINVKHYPLIIVYFCLINGFI